MKRKWTERSLKQKWVAERLFSHAGSLAGISTRLKQIASAHSTLLLESDVLLQAARLIDYVNLNLNKEESWKQFQERRG